MVDSSATPDAQNSVARCAMRSSEIGADLLTGPQSIYPFFDNKDLGGQKEAGENPARPRHCKRTELVSENVCSRTPLGLCPGKVSSWPQARRPGPPELCQHLRGGWARPKASGLAPFRCERKRGLPHVRPTLHARWLLLMYLDTWHSSMSYGSRKSVLA